MKTPPVLHPFLYPIFMLLFLYAHNIAVVPVNQIFIPLIIIIVFELLSFFILFNVLKNKEKTGIILILFAVLFFSYGYFYDLMAPLEFWNYEWYAVRSQIIFIVFSFLFFIGTYFSVKTKRNLYNFTNFLNVVAISLISISLLNIGIYNLKTSKIFKYAENIPEVEINAIDSIKPLKPPNIYYFL